MRDRVSMLIAVLLLTLVTATSYWYSREMRRPTQRTPPTPGTPDFIVEQVVMTQFDDSGHARYKLFSEHLTHFDENDDLALRRPRLVSLQPDQPQVQTSAQRARVTGSGERVLLDGDVVIRRAARGAEPAMTIRAERMVAIPDLEQFSSDVPTQIERGGSRLTGDAMHYDNLTRVLTVTGRLRGELAPATR